VKRYEKRTLSTYTAVDKHAVSERTGTCRLEGVSEA